MDVPLTMHRLSRVAAQLDNCRVLAGHHLRIDPADAATIQQAGAGVPGEPGDTAWEPHYEPGDGQDPRGGVVAVAAAIPS